VRLTLGLWGFLAALIAIAVFCQVDIATTGAGRIIPDGQVKSIQSYETGIVAEIAVRDGARVGAGEVLVRHVDSNWGTSTMSAGANGILSGCHT
jgi:multidrug efflux pump subunit AcrA (membrane-fusion protein)